MISEMTMKMNSHGNYDIRVTHTSGKTLSACEVSPDNMRYAISTMEMALLRENGEDVICEDLE